MRGLRADGTAFVFAFLLAFFFAIYGHGEEMTPDEWFRLVIQLQGQSTHLDAEERDFVRNMINALTLSEDPDHRGPEPECQLLGNLFVCDVLERP